MRRRGDASPRRRPAPDRRVHSSAPWSDPGSAAEFLDGLSGYERTGSIADKTTRRIELITSALGSPNRRFPAVHVTGTNGKGSVATMTAALLRHNGLRVGTYTSPHLDQVTERIAIDGQPVTGAQFADALGSVAWMARHIGVTPSWFEAITAAAFVVFAGAKVDVAVVEVGMLGRWDATNVVNSRVAVITNVELDHTEYAGPSRADIAMEKAGIVHPDATLVLGETDPDLMTIFEAQKPRRVVLWGRDFTVTNRRRTPCGSTVDLATPHAVHRAVPIGLLGAHQCRNAAVALASAESFLDGPLETDSVRAAFGELELRGRAEVFGTTPPIVVDGAHNRAAAMELRSTIDDHFPGRARRVVVCAVSGSRDPAEFLEGIGITGFDLVIATEANAQSVSADAVCAVARGMGCDAVVRSDVDSAIRAAVATAGAEGLVVVAGSLYLVEAARRAARSITGRLGRCDDAG